MDTEHTYRPSRLHPFRRHTRRYQLTDSELVVQLGLFSRQERRIPREKVTNVDLRVARLNAGASSVGINAGSGEPIVCDLLTGRDARSLAAALNDLG